MNLVEAQDYENTQCIPKKMTKKIKGNNGCAKLKELNECLEINFDFYS